MKKKYLLVICNSYSNGHTDVGVYFIIAKNFTVANNMANSLKNSKAGSFSSKVIPLDDVEFMEI